MKEIIKRFIPQILMSQPGLLKRDRKRISQLKDKFKGQRCFIVGNGPSLNELDLRLLKDEYSFAVNSIFYKTKEMGYKPTFFAVEDNHIIKDNLKELIDYQCEYMFFPSKFKSQIGKRSYRFFANLDYSFYVSSNRFFEKSRFSKDCAKEIFCGQTVTMINFQLAYYMGFTEIYLIGMDFNYEIPESAIVDGTEITSTEADVNHFHPDYFGKGKKWNDPKLDFVLQSYKLAKEVFEQDGRKVYNATVGGKLELFDKINYSDLFKLK
ncbi:MAG: 6-hydroxymethylpterin diphosphokinase MptE-like protein [Crocinitomicaceae bacterium]